MDSELGSRSDIRSLRKLVKMDYKKMSDGEAQNKLEVDQEIGDQVETDLRESPNQTLLGASGTSAKSRSDEPVIGQFELLFDLDWELDEAEMLLPMQRPNTEEFFLNH